MGLSPYLAMTAGEIAHCGALPGKLAYMACHFSPYGTGLSGIPRHLPEGAMLIVNDRTPIYAHDPQRIVAELTSAVEALKCGSVLLDFQRPGEAETAAVAKAVTKALPCPTAVSDLYAADPLDCPVFLPPPPLWMPLEAYCAPWAGRELWLEAALENAAIRIREDGSHFDRLPYQDPEDGFAEESLHCNYRTEVSPDEICFRLSRTPEQLYALLEEAEALGIKRAVGLHQQLHSIQKGPP